MVLTDEDGIEADLLGQLCFSADLVDALLYMFTAGWVADGRVQPEAHHTGNSFTVSFTSPDFSVEPFGHQ